MDGRIREGVRKRRGESEKKGQASKKANKTRQKSNEKKREEQASLILHCKKMKLDRLGGNLALLLEMEHPFPPSRPGVLAIDR